MSNPRHHQPIFIVVMGVSGTGKSTLGIALAKALDMKYIEGDDLHPRSNVEKMSSGTPLTDVDREPWLHLIRSTVEHATVDSKDTPGVIVGCSALRKYYREILRGRRKPATEKQSLLESAHPGVLPTYFVFIDGPKEIMVDRMESRPGHFMKASMLDSQLATLESPIGEHGVIVVSLEDETEYQVKVVKERLKHAGLSMHEDSDLSYNVVRLPL